MISIVIPVYNGSKYLAETLSSIDDQNVQIVVVNDGSTDSSKQIALKYTKYLVDIENSGPVKARNIGIKYSFGDIVFLLDADDLLIPGAIHQMFVNMDDGTDIVICQRQDFVSPDRNNKKYDLKTSNYGVLSGCALIRKKVFEEIGFFDEELLCGDAYDWILRAEKHGVKIKKMPIVTCKRRIHNENMGLLMRDQERLDYLKIIKKHFVTKK